MRRRTAAGKPRYRCNRPSGIKAVLLLAGGLVTSASMAQVSVGWDAECTYNANTDPQALQTALDAGHAEIRLSHAETYSGAIEIGENVSLRGGFADCAAANADQQSNTHSIINAGGLTTTVVKISGIDLADVRLEYLTLTGGDGSGEGYPGSGGILVQNVTGQVSLHHLDISGNAAGWGGGALGIYTNSAIEDGQLDITATETVIRDNTASNGGGIFCTSFHSSFDSYLWLSDGSVIQNNHATMQGGGIHTDRCRIEHRAGLATHSLATATDKEIHANTADQSGGGLALFGTARVQLQGTASEAFDLTANASNLDPDASGQGGAAQVSGGSDLQMTNTLVSYNSSGRYGGALFADFGGRISLASNLGECAYHRYCSQMLGNTLTGTYPGGGAAAAARFGGRIEIRTTYLYLNNAETHGYIGYADQSQEGVPATLLFEGNVIVENGQDNAYANPSAFHARDGSDLVMAYNTIRQNRVTSTLFQQLDGSNLSAFGNIIDEFSDIHQAGASAVSTINCNLVRSTDSIGVPATDLIEGSVGFFDANGHDFRLDSSDTLAMDVCDDGPYLPGYDMGSADRGQDHPGVADLNGPFDLGAYEFKPGDVDAIFSDSFGF